ncbi:hypothetical protein CQ018_12380 [Arthrobacter sp. MYb227]|nr:hypothetical protein CQ018_12380 [Arthrobacter sp. MYb227]
MQGVACGVGSWPTAEFVSVVTFMAGCPFSREIITANDVGLCVKAATLRLNQSDAFDAQIDPSKTFPDVPLLIWAKFLLERYATDTAENGGSLR